MGGNMIRKVIIAVVIVAGIAGGWYWWQGQQSPLPEGIVFGNGRIEADEVDISTKYAGRVQEILVHEGDLIQAGQTLARMDTAELKAKLEKAKADLAEAQAAVNEAKAQILQRESEFKFAKQELERALPLVRKGSLAKRTAEQRQSNRDTAEAAVKAAKARIVTMKRSVEAARAVVKQIQTQIDDSILKTPVMGRVLYRLTEPGEILSSGGKVLTVLNLSRIYMEFFLPSREATQIAIGTDARIVLDAFPQFAIPANVSFISPEAQFTPKQVETLSERDKLMFRVKVQIASERVLPHIKKVKTGVRGIAYVRLNETVSWPDDLERRYTGDLE
jgi:HlyD family secretion protein